MARILVIDSYDSFVYNIVQYLGELGAEPIVVRNDQISVADAIALEPDGVLLSPGPGRPEDAGIICDAISAFAGSVPVFGVCFRSSGNWSCVWRQCCARTRTDARKNFAHHSQQHRRVRRCAIAT